MNPPSRPTPPGAAEDAPQAAPASPAPAPHSGGHPAADSAGHPWAGRTFDAHPTTFATDDGAAPEALLAALAHFRALTAAARTPSAATEPSGASAALVAAHAATIDAARTAALDAAHAAVVDAVRDARLLVPLVAHAGETGLDEHGRTIDKTQELSLVTVRAPDGRTALPAFTSTEAMARWNPQARPIPTPARRVALAAAGEGTDLVVLDPASSTEFAIRRPALWAIAEARPWTPPLAEQAVRTAFAASVAEEPAVRGLRLTPGDPEARLSGTEVVAELTLLPGLDREALAALLQRVQQRWAASAAIADAVDSLSVRLATAP